MLRSSALAALLLALGLSGPALAADTGSQAKSHSEHTGASSQSGNAGSSELNVYETDNLFEDDYGYYDQDFDYDVGDDDFNGWYGGSDAYWQGYSAGYDAGSDYDSAEFSAYETNGLYEDDYGYYDNDFSYDASDDFNSWYGDADEDWSVFDDAGEQGFFDW